METPSTAAPSEEGQSGELSRPTVPAPALGPEEASGPSSWQTDSLASSWATVGTLDPDEPKSLETSDALLLAEERSENHSSISDIVHLEREEAELLEEAEQQQEQEEGEEVSSLKEVDEEEAVIAEEVDVEEAEELQSSTISVLGTEKELAELHEEHTAQEIQMDFDKLKAPKTEEMLMSTEESEFQEEPEEVIWPLSSTPPPAISAIPPLALAPEPTPLAMAEPEFNPVKEVLSSLPKLTQELVREAPKVLEEVKESQQEIPIPSALPAPATEVPKESPVEPVVAPLAMEETIDILPNPVPVAEETKPPVPKSSSFELPKVIYGSAALVAVMGMVAYGALALTRK